jgi:hypothetical protein
VDPTLLVTVIGILVGFMQAVIILLLTSIRSEINDIWQRMNNHYHEVGCGNKDCTALHTGNVIIPRGGK